MNKYNNGHVINTVELSRKEYELAAKEWAEGNKPLEELLLYFLNNNIKTIACCAGHDNMEESYIMFEFNSQNMMFIISIINRYYNFPGVNMRFLSIPGERANFTITVPKLYRDRFFSDMLSYIKTKPIVYLSSISDDMKYILNIFSEHKIPGSFIEAQYFFENEKKRTFIAFPDIYSYPIYYRGGLTGFKRRLWVDDTIGIKDETEKMLPLLNEVANEIKIVNEMQKKQTEEIKQTKPNQDFINNQPSIEKNDTLEVEKTELEIEFEYVGLGHELTHIKCLRVLPRDSIKLVAEKLRICKEKGILAFAIFNDIEIDNFEVSEPNLIIEQYERKLEERRKSKNKVQDKKILSNEEKSRLYEIKKKKAKGLYVDDIDLEFEELCIGTYEDDIDLHMLVVFDNYNEMMVKNKNKVK